MCSPALYLALCPLLVLVLVLVLGAGAGAGCWCWVLVLGAGCWCRCAAEEPGAANCIWTRRDHLDAATKQCFSTHRRLLTVAPLTLGAGLIHCTLSTLLEAQNTDLSSNDSSTVSVCRSLADGAPGRLAALLGRRGAQVASLVLSRVRISARPLPFQLSVDPCQCARCQPKG